MVQHQVHIAALCAQGHSKFLKSLFKWADKHLKEGGVVVLVVEDMLRLDGLGPSFVPLGALAVSWVLAHHPEYVLATCGNSVSEDGNPDSFHTVLTYRQQYGPMNTDLLDMEGEPEPQVRSIVDMLPFPLNETERELVATILSKGVAAFATNDTVEEGNCIKTKAVAVGVGGSSEVVGYSIGCSD